MSLERTLLRDEADPEAFLDGLYDGVVKKVSGSMLHFIIPDFSGDQLFGPAPFSRPQGTSGASSGHTHDLLTADDPPAGTKCVVGFVDGDPASPRVLAIYGWPG